MTPLSSTLSNLTAAQLVAFCTANMPLPPEISGTPAPDPNNVNDSQPNQLQNLQGELNRVYGLNGLNGDNLTILGLYARLCHIWEEGGKTGPPPAFPVFEIVDPASWLTWWFLLNTVDEPSSPNYGSGAFVESMEANKYYIKAAPAIPAVIILAAGVTVAPAAPVTEGPIGAPVPGNPTLFYSSGAPADMYPNGYVWMGATGVYQKEVFLTPFMQVATQYDTVWQALVLTPVVPAAAAIPAVAAAA